MLKVHRTDLSCRMVVDMAKVTISVLGLAPLIIKVLNNYLQDLLVLHAVAVMKDEQIVVPLVVNELRVVLQDVHALLFAVKQLKAARQMASHI